MLERLSHLVNRGFVVIVVVAAVVGALLPGGFLWMGVSFGLGLPLVGGPGTVEVFGTVLPVAVDVNGIIVGLGMIMFGMGMTLSWSEVKQSLSHPGRIVLDTACQYLVMPLVAFGLVLVLELRPVFAAGVILLGCCPGGTASNVIAFLARADVPLSVSVTLTSTLLAPVVTPFLTWFYAQELLGFFRGEVIDVPVALLARSIVIIVVPILLGLWLKQSCWGDEPVPTVKRGFTLFSVVVIALIVAYVVGSARQDGVLGMAWILVAPVVLHNLLGLAVGYGAGLLSRVPLDAVRTLSIEVGMQNSGLAVALSGVLAENLRTTGAFDPEQLSLIAVPAVMFSVWHNISGPLLASIWGRRETPHEA